MSHLVGDSVLLPSGLEAVITDVCDGGTIYLDHSSSPYINDIFLIKDTHNINIGKIFLLEERVDEIDICYHVRIGQFNYFCTKYLTRGYYVFKALDSARHAFKAIIKEFENLTTFDSYVKFDSLVRPTTDIGCDELICPDGNYIIVNKKSKKYWGDEGWESKTPKKFTKTEIKAAWKLAAEAQHKHVWGEEHKGDSEKTGPIEELNNIVDNTARPLGKVETKTTMKKNEWEPWRVPSSGYVLRMLSKSVIDFSIRYLDHDNNATSHLTSARYFVSAQQAMCHLQDMRSHYLPIIQGDTVIHKGYSTTNKVKTIGVDTYTYNRGYELCRSEILDILPTEKSPKGKKVLIGTIASLTILAGLCGGSQVYFASHGLTEKELGCIEDFKEETGLEVGDTVVSKTLGKYKTPYKKTGIITGFYPNDYTMEIEVDWAEGQRDRVYEGDIVGVIE